MRRGRGRLPGAQLHAGVRRGAGHVPERLAGSEADGNVALWRGCTLRVSGNRKSRWARTPMGQSALYRPQSCRLGNPKIHVRESVDARDDRAGSLVRAWLEGDWTVIE